jgi:uncharacterized protein YkwD
VRSAPPRRAPLAAALAALACAAAPVPAPAPPAPPAPPAGPAGAAAPACTRYGEEPAVSLAPLEGQVLDLARGRLAAGGARPRVSPALVLAARELARAAAEGRPDPLARRSLRAALARACAADPAPVAILVQAPAGGAAAAAAEALPRARATHVGAGVHERGGTATAVLLVSGRAVRLAPFPRDVAPGARVPLAAALGAGLARPRVFLATPSGQVAEVAAAGERDLRAEVAFPVAGRYRLEVIADGEGGPEVAALLTVSAGEAPLEEPPAPSPADPPEGAEAAVARAVNATRRAQGLAPLRPAPALDEIARRHAAAMAAGGRVAHVLPGSGDLGARLRGARIPYRRAWENVARAAGALAAHEAAEESPAHLANVLRREAGLLGVGVARAPGPSGGEAVYLAEVFVEPPDDGAASPLTPDARVREALWSERARLALPPLTADAPLDALAREAALDLAARDATEAPPDLGDRALALRRSLAAVDVFVASGPEEAARSANLRDRRWRRVGVGVTTADSGRFGARRAWIVVVYTD